MMTKKNHPRFYLLLLALIPYFVQAQLLGDPDTSFQTGTGLANQSPIFFDYTPSGKLLVVGDFNTYNGTTVNRLALLDSFGILDMNFRSNMGTGPNLSVRSAAVDTNGRIYIGGIFSNFNGFPRSNLVRLLPNGTIDSSFMPGTGPNNEVTSITLGMGRIVITGFFNSYDGLPRQGLAVLHDDGTLDTTFQLAFPAIGAQTRKVIIYPDGRMLAFGNFNVATGSPANRIIRLTPNGGIDSSFSSGQGANSTIMDAALLPNGQIYIAGAFTAYNGFTRIRVARLHANGVIDSTFDPGAGFNGVVQRFLLQPDGKLLLMHSQFNGTYQGIPSTYLTRINPNATLDLDFNNLVTASVTGPINQALLQGDAKLLLGGNFTSYRLQTHNRIIRLHMDSAAVASTNYFIALEVVLTGGLPGDPDSLRIAFDTTPFSGMAQAANHFYVRRILPGSWQGTATIPVSEAIFSGSRTLFVARTCRFGTTFFSLQTSAVLGFGNDSTLSYFFQDDHCDGGFPLALDVYGTVHSAGGLQMVNNHSTVLILGRANPASPIFILDTLSANSTNMGRTYMMRDSSLQYSAVALPNPTHPFLFANNLPTYLGGQVAWQQATWVMPTPNGFADSLVLAPTSPTNNSNNAGGYVFTAGNNKQGDPAAQILMVLFDKSGLLVDFAWTDSGGDYQINQLDSGRYRIRAEVLGKRSDEVWFDLGVAQPQLTSLDFEVRETEVVFVGTISIPEHVPSIAAVYPNPVSDYLTIRLATGQQLEAFQIHNAHGQTVSAPVREVSGGWRIEVSHLAAGVYFLNAQFINGNLQSLKFIKP
jgi:uncharacterized delta-60 repeat protein